jgi:cob(I)alamin adenosyltransferase
VIGKDLEGKTEMSDKMVNKRKPEKVITKIRTGTGDFGTTYFRGIPNWQKASLEIEYLGQLDVVQAFLVLDKKYTRLSYDLKKAQNLVFALGANFNSPENKKYIAQVNELTEEIESSIELMTKNLEPLSGFLRTNEDNSTIRQACTFIRQAEIIYNRYCIYQLDRLNHRKSLNILSDYLFALAWRETVILDPDTMEKYIVIDYYQWKGENV